MLVNNLRAIGLHIIICIISFILITLSNLPVPQINLKDSFRIGTFDLYAGIFLILFVFLLYIIAGSCLKPRRTRINNLLSCVSVSVLYMAVACWIFRNNSSLSYTLNDPTPDQSTRVMGSVLLGIFCLYNIPLQILQWLPLKIQWINKYFFIVIGIVPSIMMYLGIEIKRSRLKSSSQK